MSIVYPPPCANCAYEGESADLHNLIQIQTERIVKLERELAEALALLQMNEEYRKRASALIADQEDLLNRVINRL